MTLYLAFGLLLVVLAVIAVNSKRRGRSGNAAPSQPQTLQQAPRQTPQQRQPQTHSTGPSPGQREHPSAPTPLKPSRAIPAIPAAIPEALAQLRLTRLGELPPAQTASLVARLQHIPRPPKAMDKLISAEFLAQASSGELSELMVGEPEIAARVLATVNSSMYGLQKPLASLGQAANYLGTNTVRGICLQYLLDASFKSSSPEAEAVYQSVWSASAFASALCFKLAQLLKLPEPGHLVTQVVLSYLGPLATYSLVDNAAVLHLAHCDPVEAARTEQEQLGLCASEIGTLLLQTWKLPASLIQDAQEIGQILVAPCAAPGDARYARLALCYLCMRIGAALAAGRPVDFMQLDLDNPELLELHFLPGYLQHPSMERLNDFLKLPEIVGLAKQMASATQFRAHARN